MTVDASGAPTSGLREYFNTKAGTGNKVAALELTETGGFKLPENFEPVRLMDFARPVPETELAVPEMRHLLDAIAYGEELGEYGEFSSASMRAQAERNQATFERLNAGCGGMLSGAAIPNDIFGFEPVRTTMGGIHPNSDRIKEYLREHAMEWKSMTIDVPSFEEWRQSRG